MLNSSEDVRVDGLHSARLIIPRDGQVTLCSDGTDQPAAGEGTVHYCQRIFENVPDERYSHVLSDHT
jgi:hypothetical protein